MIAETWRYGGGDDCAEFFGAMLLGANPPISPTATVLEIGCAEFNWLQVARASWPAMRLHGIDWRRSEYQSPYVVQGDALSHAYSPASFDWIVAISTMEHFGLGHYDHDPRDLEGDIKGMARAFSWLKPGGWMSLDVPWNAGDEAYRVHDPWYRVYDDAQVQARLIGSAPWVERWRGWATVGAPRELLPRAPTTHLHGGGFYFIGLWLQKPETEH